MKKKILLLVLAILMIASASSFAIGIGGAFSFSPIGSSPYNGGALSLKIDDLPLLGVSVSASNGQFNIGGTADWWMYNEPLVEILNLYAGIGGFASISLGTSTNFDLGVRIPVGLNIFVLDPLELFLEVAPAVGVTLGDNFNFPSWGLQSAIGFRFWF